MFKKLKDLFRVEMLEDGELQIDTSRGENSVVQEPVNPNVILGQTSQQQIDKIVKQLYYINFTKRGIK